MRVKKPILVSLLISILLSSFFSSCASQKDLDVEVAVIVALTQTAAALQTSAPLVVNQTQTPAGGEVEQATSAPPTRPVDLKGYQPLDIRECKALGDALFKGTGNPTAITLPVPFNDYVNNMPGLGCQIAFEISNFNNLMSLSAAAFDELGWQVDARYGLNGPNGEKMAFRHEDSLCVLIHTELSSTITCSTYVP